MPPVIRATATDAGRAEGRGVSIDRLNRRGRTILVSAPSGGTGVTSVALHIAAEFVARNHRTALVDLDPARGAHARLGLDAGDDPDAPVPVAGGFRLVRTAVSLDDSERVVIDAPVGWLPEVDAIDAGVLVCAPSPRGADRAHRMLEEHTAIPWHVVVNRLGPGGETTRTRFARTIGREVMELPCCPALRDAEDVCVLLARGWTRWSRRVRRLAALLDA